MEERSPCNIWQFKYVDGRGRKACITVGLDAADAEDLISMFETRESLRKFIGSQKRRRVAHDCTTTRPSYKNKFLKKRF